MSIIPMLAVVIPTVYFLPNSAAVSGKICSHVGVNGSCIFPDEVSDTFN